MQETLGLRVGQRLHDVQLCAEMFAFNHIGGQDAAFVPKSYLKTSYYATGRTLYAPCYNGFNNNPLHFLIGYMQLLTEQLVSMGDVTTVVMHLCDSPQGFDMGESVRKAVWRALASRGHTNLNVVSFYGGKPLVEEFKRGSIYRKYHANQTDFCAEGLVFFGRQGHSSA